MGRKLEEQLNVRIGKAYLDTIDKLLEKQIYTSKAELVRDALRNLFAKYNVGIGEEE